MTELLDAGSIPAHVSGAALPAVGAPRRFSQDRAFEWLDKSVEARDWQMPLLEVEPAFDDLRSDRRFGALVERVGLPR